MQLERIDPQILLLASKFDLACDYVVSHLRRRRASYFRLNTEDFDQFAIVAFPDEPSVLLRTEGLEILLEQPQLKANLLPASCLSARSFHITALSRRATDQDPPLRLYAELYGL